MHHKVKDALEEIDAAVFNGDDFDRGFDRDTLREYMARWTRALDEKTDGVCKYCGIAIGKPYNTCATCADERGP